MYVANMTGIESFMILTVFCVIWFCLGAYLLIQRVSIIDSIGGPVILSIILSGLWFLTRHRIYAKVVELTPEGLFVNTGKKTELISLDQVQSILHQDGYEGAHSWLHFADGRHIVFYSPTKAKPLLDAISEATGLPFVHKKARMGT